MPAEQLTPDRTREAGVVCDVFVLGAGSTVAALAARVEWDPFAAVSQPGVIAGARCVNDH